MRVSSKIKAAITGEEFTLISSEHETIIACMEELHDAERVVDKEMEEAAKRVLEGAK